MKFTRHIDNALYSRKALAKAREAYLKYCTVQVAQTPAGLVGVTVTVKPEFQQDARQVVLEFWNFFLDTACQQRFELA
jgi:hypothetical protein